MSLSRSPTTTTDAASVNSAPARSTPRSQRMLSLSSIARWRRGAASMASSRVQICASSRPRTASVSLSMATRGWMKKPAETPSPAAPSPRRLAVRPAKLISVVSCATTMRRPAVADCVRPARVASISWQVTDGADRKRWIASSPARVAPSLRITSEPVAVTRSINSVPTAARRASPK
jgi:hypothetical protein